MMVASIKLCDSVSHETSFCLQRSTKGNPLLRELNVHTRRGFFLFFSVQLSSTKQTPWNVSVYVKQGKAPCKWTQHCWELLQLFPRWLKFGQVSNFAQQLATTYYNRMCKRTQHVTSNICQWELLANNVASVCS